MMQGTELELILRASWMVKWVLSILGFLSVISWAIIWYKQRYFSAAFKESEEFRQVARKKAHLEDLLKATQHLRATPLAAMLREIDESSTAPSETDRDNLLQQAEAKAVEQVYSRLTFLATTGSTAPFIGLFGTVWGIMNAFQSIGMSGSASLAVVAPGIAEALITTAVGLATAIPAVVAYNYFLSRARRLSSQAEIFSKELRIRFHRSEGTNR